MADTFKTDTHSDSATPSLVEGRRAFLKKLGLGAGAAAVGTGVFNIQTAAAQGVTWRIQSSWQPGTTGYAIFEGWANEMQELSGGELTITPFAAGSIAGDFQLVDAVRNGVIEGMNVFTVYWAGRMPAGVFLSSFPLGLNHPHQWDMMFGAHGGRAIAEELYMRNGLKFVTHVHHDMNLIHSKVPINSLDDFNGLLLRVPGGIVAECFAEIGARTTLLPGSEVYPALERGTVDAADFVGPAVNYDLGFHQVTNYVVMGPASTPCLHQPVDLMDLSISLNAWNAASESVRNTFTAAAQAYSMRHYAGIQAANHEAWGKLAEAGTTVTRLSEDDVARFREVAIPKWFEWANKDPMAARLFRSHLSVMQDPAVGYITPDDIAGFDLRE